MCKNTSPWNLATLVDVKQAPAEKSVSFWAIKLTTRTTVGSATQVLGLLILMRLGIILRSMWRHSGNSETWLSNGD